MAYTYKKKSVPLNIYVSLSLSLLPGLPPCLALSRFFFLSLRGSRTRSLTRSHSPSFLLALSLPLTHSLACTCACTRSLFRCSLYVSHAFPHALSFAFFLARALPLARVLSRARSLLLSEPAYQEVEVELSDDECPAILHIKVLQARDLIAADSGGTCESHKTHCDTLQRTATHCGALQLTYYDTIHIHAGGGMC